MMLVGCRYFLGDGPNGGPDDPRCFGHATIAADGICLATLPIDPLQITGRFVTDNDPRCLVKEGDDGFTAYCVVAGSDVMLAGMFVGDRPLVVLAVGTVTIADRVDVSARIVGDPPAGSATDGVCNMGVAAVEQIWGAAGGSFGCRGGNGGRNDGDIPCNTSCTAGDPIALDAPTGLRGGCRGQSAAVNGAHGGLGGGALAVIAKTKIEITSGGSIDASGAGGAGGHPIASGSPYIAGGAGGGSGGMIVLDAPEIDVTGLVFADGGGGGEGSTDSLDGLAGALPNGQERAPGGSSTLTGGDGGSGSHAATLDGESGAVQDGTFSGGGGGGGAGVIWLHGAADLGGGAISPEPTIIGDQN